MKDSKSIVYKFLCMILSVALLSTSVLGIGLLYSGYSALNALSTSTDTSTYVKVDELWDSEAKAMSGDNVSKLLSYLSSDGTIDGVQASTPQTATDIRGYTYGGKSAEQSVVVRLGGLDWIVTYISTSISTSDTGDKIATLWLSNCIQDAFVGRSQTEGEMYGYVTTSVGTGLYSDWSYDWYSESVDTYPSNMYSTSYIRVVTLNNGGYYAIDNSNLIDEEYQSKEDSVFAEFTIDSTSSVGDFDALTDYIVIPNQVSWQKNRQDSVNLIGLSNYMNNESITEGGDYSGYDYSKIGNYSDWGSDYLWLPSLTEMGYDSSNDGLWEVSIEERKNYDGSTTRVSSSVSPGSNNTTSTYTYAYSWSRSAFYNHSHSAFNVDPSGAGSDLSNVLSALAVRPALHLNLSALSTVVSGGEEGSGVEVTINGVPDGSATIVDTTQYNVSVLDSNGAIVYSRTFDSGATNNTVTTVSLQEGATYTLLAQVPAGYATFVTISGQTYYAKVINFVAQSDLVIGVEARLRSQGWFDDVTIY